MDQYKCARCGVEFRRKDALINHLKRKTECIPHISNTSRESIVNDITTRKMNEKTFDCDYCKKQFNQASCKSRHKKTCKQNPSNINTNNIINTENVDVASTSATYVVIEKEQLNYMLKKIEDFDKQLSILDVQPVINSTCNINNVTNTNNHININLNNFGQETTSHLSSDFLSHCILNPSKGFPSLIQNIHYNNEVPENHNIRCRSLKRNIFETYVDSEWKPCDASNTLDELIKKGYRILNAHYTVHFMNDPDIFEDVNKQRAYERFRFLSDRKCSDYFAVKRELRLLVKDRTTYLLASPESDSIENIDSNNVVDTTSPLDDANRAVS
jgi:hypothetical protein